MPAFASLKVPDTVPSLPRFHWVFELTGSASVSHAESPRDEDGTHRSWSDVESPEPWTRRTTGIPTMMSRKRSGLASEPTDSTTTAVTPTTRMPNAGKALAGSFSKA